MSSYELDHSHGIILELDDTKSRAIIDVSESSSAITWPTELTTLNALKVLSQIFEIRSGYVSVHASQMEILHVSLDQLLNTEIELDEPIQVARIDDTSARTSIIWQIPLGQQDCPAEAGIVVEHIDQERLIEALNSTGNDAVKKAAGQIALTAKGESSKSPKSTAI